MISSFHIRSLIYLLVIVAQLSPVSIDAKEEQNSTQRVCDKDFCDDVTTMCTANMRCSCNFKDKFCRKDCIDCLEEKFGKCCGCITGLCPAIKKQTSHVGDIAESEYDDLFNVLTEENDKHGRWTVMRGSSSKPFNHLELGKVRVALDKSNKRLTLSSLDEQQIDLNQDDYMTDEMNDDSNQSSSCVVAFINKHLSMSQCKRYCRSMGASSFRWFHNGCCECVGKSCIRYGIDEPECLISDY